MKTIQGSSRHQMEFISLDDQVAVEDPVRIVDAFVEKLDLKRLGIERRGGGFLNTTKDLSDIISELSLIFFEPDPFGCFGADGGARRREIARGDVQSGSAADSSEELPDVPPAGRNRAHVLSDIQGHPPLG